MFAQCAVWRDICVTSISVQVTVDNNASLKVPSAVHVIHVLLDMSQAEPGVIWGEINNEKRARHATDALRERLLDDKSRDVQIEIEFGDPGYRIADRAKQLEADLVVMPSHGRTGFKRLLIGSVAERVIRLAHCPVLVLRK